MSDANKPLDVAVVLVDVEEAGSDCGVEQFADEEKKEDVQGNPNPGKQPYGASGDFA